MSRKGSGRPFRATGPCEHNVQIHWVDKESCARGIAGQARTVGIGGTPGVLEAVLADDVPLLLPVTLPRALDSVVDFPANKLGITYMRSEANMVTLPSGHAAVDILDFWGIWLFRVQQDVCRKS